MQNIHNKLTIKEVPDKYIYQEFFRRVRCSHYPERMIVLFGPPGSGKGTQGMKLVDELCGCHLSTGDLLRKEIRDKSELGKHAEEIMNRGELVPDQVVLDIIEKNVFSDQCRKGAVFDGFPRTVEQAKKLDEILNRRGKKIDRVFNFEVDDNTLVDR
jgi:adenylate kinase